MLKCNLIRRALALLALVFVNAAYADVVVIVSAKSPITSLSADQVSKIFLGKSSTFPNHKPAYPIDQQLGSPVRDEFYEKVVHKDASQLAAYWAKIIFTGEGRPPKLIVGDKAVVKTIADNPDAIGYIDSSALNHSVKAVLVP